MGRQPSSRSSKRPATPAHGPPPAWRALLLFVLFLLGGNVHGETPLLSQFRPTIDAYPEYYSMVEGADRAFYLGGTDEVLRFDGTRWTRIALPHPGAVRSLAIDGNGRIWVGATDCFGYLETDDAGRERFVDLSGQFAAETQGRLIADIWHLLVRPDGVYFQALRDLFRLDSSGRRTGYWHHEGRFGALASLDGELYVQFRGVSLQRLHEDRFEPVIGGGSFSDTLIISLFEFAPRQLLAFTSRPSIELWSPDGRHAQIDWPQLRDALEHFTRIYPLPDGRLAATGDDGTLRLLDPAGKSIEDYAIDIGFQKDLQIGADGALWVQDGEGLIRMPWPPRWNSLGRESGLVGSLHALRIADDTLYVLSGAGTYSGKRGETGRFDAFTHLDWTTSEAWDVLPTSDGLLFAESYVLRQIRASKARDLSGNDLYPRRLQPSDHCPGRVWVLTEQGLALAQTLNGEWQLSARHTQMQTRVDSLVELGEDQFLLGSEKRGLLQLRLSPDAQQLLSLDEIGKEAGLEYGDGRQSMVARIEGLVVVSTRAGLFVRDGKRFQRADLHGLSRLLHAGEVVQLLSGADGRQWALSFRAIYSRSGDGDWRLEEVSAFRRGSFESLLTLPDGGALVGALGHLYRFAPVGNDASIDKPRLSLASVRAEDAPLSRVGTTQLASPAPALEFELAFSDFSHATPPQFRARLHGHEDAFSGWRPTATFSYASLPPGRYRFEAQARDADGREFSSPAHEIEIVPRWFERGWVRIVGDVLAALLLIALGVGLTRLRVRRLKRRNRELDDMVHARTAALESANLRLRDQAERDGLTGVANRRRFDQVLAEFHLDCSSRGLPLALLLIDVDHFKDFNDRHGHLAGDHLLQAIAQTIATQCRGRDGIAARYGGEEFGLLLRAQDRNGALQLAEQTRAAVEKLHAITVSIGVAVLQPKASDDPADLLAMADDALYRAKNAGRNRIAA